MSAPRSASAPVMFDVKELVSLADPLRLLRGLSAFYNRASTTGRAVDYFCTENSEERLDLVIGFLI